MCFNDNPLYCDDKSWSILTLMPFYKIVPVVLQSEGCNQEPVRYKCSFELS